MTTEIYNSCCEYSRQWFELLALSILRGQLCEVLWFDEGREGALQAVVGEPRFRRVCDADRLINRYGLKECRTCNELKVAEDTGSSRV